MNKIKTLALCIATLFASNAVAQKLVIDNISVVPGGDPVNAVVKIESEKIAKNTEFHLTFPQGISIAFDEDAEEYLYEEGAILPSKPSITVDKEGNGDMAVVIYKNGKQTYKEASGVIIELPIIATAETAEADYTIDVHGIVIGDANGPFEETEESTQFTVTVSNTVGIRSINADGTDGDIYNTAGQRVSRTSKGLYIQNGKKVVKK